MAEDKNPKLAEKQAAKAAKAARAARPEKQAETQAQDTPRGPARLKEIYKNEIAGALTQQFGYKSPMEVPRITKITINMGVGEAATNKKILENAVADLAKITGQKPIITKSKKSIAAFKLRENQAIGCKVTLRGDRMWEFLDRLIAVAIPRIRDFRGLPAHSWDSRGNYTFGLADQIVFPEIDYDKIDAPHGMDITIVTTADNDAAGRALLDAFGFPFRQADDPNAAAPKLRRRNRGPVRGKRK